MTDASYRLRGNRVQPLSEWQIRNVALNVANEFKLNRKNKKNIDQAFEALSKFNISLKVVDDDDWLFVTKGHYDPKTMTISIPERIYLNACNGERDALAVMLHEMGHLFLGHTLLLHHSDTEAKKEEDAEWQADTFAYIILNYMGYQTTQLSFDFYME